MGAAKINNSTVGEAVGVNYGAAGKAVEVSLAVGKVAKVED